LFSRALGYLVEPFCAEEIEVSADAISSSDARGFPRIGGDLGVTAARNLVLALVLSAFIVDALRNKKRFDVHGHQCSLYFQNFENFKSYFFYVSKNYEDKYIDRYIHGECMQKSIVKNTLYFGKYKKDKFLRANSSKIIVQ
jgi:hypothetical protein